jgi:hypothetical protein
MTDEERLLVQNSVSLSIALISFSAALIGGAVAGFLAISDKIKSGSTAIVLVSVVVLSILALTFSIYYGGRGISSTNASLSGSPAHLPAHYDQGYFSWQVLAGVGGLLVGALAFIILAAVAMTNHQDETTNSPSVKEMAALRATLQKMGSQVETAGSQIEKAGTQIDKLSAQIDQAAPLAGSLNKQFASVLTAAQDTEKLLMDVLADAKLLLEANIQSRHRDTGTPAAPGKH